MTVASKRTHSFEVDAAKLFVEVLEDRLAKLAVSLGREYVIDEPALEQLLRRQLFPHQEGSVTTTRLVSSELA